MSLKPIFHDGAQVSLDHLAPTSFACPCPQIGRELAVGLSFSNHCYTEKFDGRVHDGEQIVLYNGGGRPRVFCPIRYRLSRDLPGIVCALHDKKVFQTAERRNYLYAARLVSQNEIYEIYFMLQRAENIPGQDLRLTVESAYPVPSPTPLPKRPRSIRFIIPAHKTLTRQRVIFAAR